jgi:outer membrane translocation and assembly module TamA
MKQICYTFFIFFLFVNEIVVFSRPLLIGYQCIDQVDSVCQLKGVELLDSAKASINIQLLLDQFYNSGYLTANLDTVIADSSSYRLYFYQGSCYYWGRVGSVNVSESVLRKIKGSRYISESKPLKIDDLNAYRRNLIQYYENHAYPFASAQFTNASLDSTHFNADIKVEPNTYFLFDSIVVRGEAKISNNFLVHFLDIKRNREFSQHKVNRMSLLYNQVAFLHEIKPSQVLFKNGKADVYTYLRTKSANSINGIAGFVPDEEKDGKIKLTGELNLSLINAFSRGENVFLEWKKLDGPSQKLFTHVSYPYFFKSNFGAAFNFSLYKYDTLYLTTNPIYRINYFNYGLNAISVFIDQKNSSVIGSGYKFSSDSAFLPDVVAFKRLLYGIGIYQQELDYLYNPQKGYLIDIDAGFGYKELKWNDEMKMKFNQTEIRSDMSLYIPTGKITAIKLRNQTGWIQVFKNQNDTMQFNGLASNELFRIGGVYSLRGFDEDILTASFYSILSLEYRLLFDKNSCVYLFFDGAYQENNIQNYTSDYPYGFGVGLNLDSRAGVIIINYALGHQLNNKIELRSSKIHIGLINRF